LDALREEMLAHNFLASQQFAFLTATPQQRFQDWLSVNDRIVVEAAALPVESFVDKVPEPTETELAKFFEDQREREPQPDLVGPMEFPSPVPGFRLPRKIDVQYIQADYDQLLVRVENEITEEEIAKYYEENKDPLFIRADTGLIDDLPTNPPDAEPSGETPAVDTAPATENAVPATEAQPVSEPETTQPESEPNSESATSPPAGSENAVPESQPAANETQQPMETNNTEEQSPDTERQSSDGRGAASRVFRLAAYLQQENDNTANNDAAADTGPTTTSSILGR
jgi:hypothetical protein